MLERLKDQELLQNCKVQVQLEKAATSKVLDYLIEIDKRDRKSTRLNSSHSQQSRMPSSA